MTEKEYEIQQLTRENAEIRKQRDLLMQENDEFRKELHELKERLKPKKPIKGIGFSYLCPCCGFAMGSLVRDKYCCNCGQALDWSDSVGEA